MSQCSSYTGVKLSRRIMLLSPYENLTWTSFSLLTSPKVKPLCHSLSFHSTRLRLRKFFSNELALPSGWGYSGEPGTQDSAIMELTTWLYLIPQVKAAESYRNRRRVMPGSMVGDGNGQEPMWRKDKLFANKVLLNVCHSTYASHQFPHCLHKAVFLEVLRFGWLLTGKVTTSSAQTPRVDMSRSWIEEPRKERNTLDFGYNSG